MRVVAGSAGGRRLVAPPGRHTRPTSDRVREALFSSLAHRGIVGVAVLDLYAGSGALGIEALSRGAATATFVERDPRAAAAIEANLETTGLAERAAVRRLDAAAFCARPDPPGPYGIVLCDPPYDTALDHVYGLVAQLDRAGSLTPDGAVVIERSKRDPQLATAPPPSLAHERTRSYGDTVLLHLRRRSSGAEPTPVQESSP